MLKLILFIGLTATIFSISNAGSIEDSIETIFENISKVKLSFALEKLPELHRDVIRSSILTNKILEMDPVIAKDTLEELIKEASAKVVELLNTDPKGAINLNNPGAYVVLYQHSNHNGQRLDLHLQRGECRNVDSWFNDRASSINTNWACVNVYEHGNCGGASARVEPGSSGHSNLAWIGMNDKISSVRMC